MRCLTLSNSLLAFQRVNTPDTPPLDIEVRQLLDLHRGQWQAIADATHVSYSWLSKFSRGKITNPGYATLNRLHEYLRERPVMPPPLPPPVPPPASAMVAAVGAES